MRARPLRPARDAGPAIHMKRTGFKVGSMRIKLEKRSLKGRTHVFFFSFRRELKKDERWKMARTDAGGTARMLRMNRKWTEGERWEWGGRERRNVLVVCLDPFGLYCLIKSKIQSFFFL